MNGNLMTKFKFMKKAYFVVLLSFFINVVVVNPDASASTREDAQSSVVKFLKAHRDCDVAGMMKHSQYFREIGNQKEFYTSFCKHNPLQKAKITSLSIVNESTALVSIETTYKDRITLRTTPVVKKDGQWKVVIGVPPSGVKAITPSRDGNKAEISKVFTDYVKAIKTQDLSKMKSYLKILDQTEDKKIDEHLKAMGQGPIPEMTSYGINILSDDLAIAEVEIKYPNHTFTHNLAVLNENGQWKIIFGHPLTISSVPVSGKPVEIK